MNFTYLELLQKHNKGDNLAILEPNYTPQESPIDVHNQNNIILGTISPVKPLNYSDQQALNLHIINYFLPFIYFVEFITIYPEFDENHRLHYHFSFKLLNSKDSKVKYHRHIRLLQDIGKDRPHLKNFSKYNIVKDDYEKSIKYHQKDWETTKQLFKKLSQPISLNYLNALHDLQCINFLLKSSKEDGLYYIKSLIKIYIKSIQ